MVITRDFVFMRYLRSCVQFTHALFTADLRFSTSIFACHVQAVGKLAGCRGRQVCVGHELWHRLGRFQSCGAAMCDPVIAPHVDTPPPAVAACLVQMDVEEPPNWPGSASTNAQWLHDFINAATGAGLHSPGIYASASSCVSGVVFLLCFVAFGCVVVFCMVV